MLGDGGGLMGGDAGGLGVSIYLAGGHTKAVVALHTGSQAALVRREEK